MKKALQIGLGLGFWIVFCIILGLSESDNSGLLFASLVVFSLICWILNKIDWSDETEKENTKQ